MFVEAKLKIHCKYGSFAKWKYGSFAKWKYGSFEKWNM